MAREVTLTRSYHFSAAHELTNPRLSPAANAALYGACHRPHGHNYYVDVTVAGVPDATTGMAVDVAAVDERVQRLLLDQIDHHKLEEAPALAGVITTGESLARAFWRVLAPAMAPGTLRSVVVVETAKNRFEYRGEGA
jgi:6-pyruvoyltetrahydropterin/6-carboxytetrahydropterin synthase